MSTSTINALVANVVSSTNDVISANLPSIVLIGLGLALVFFAVRLVKRALR